MKHVTPIITRARTGKPLSSLNRKKRGTMKEELIRTALLSTLWIIIIGGLVAIHVLP